MRDNPMVGHILLEKGERSALANLAIECLWFLNFSIVISLGMAIGTKYL
jgi:hypothetical protein